MLQIVNILYNKINQYFKAKTAIEIDPRTIRLKKPTNLSMPEFLAKVQNINYYIFLILIKKRMQ